jgi:putative ABC transport system permease protein
MHTVVDSIDQYFANSPHETKSASEKQYFDQFLKKIGDVEFIVQSVIGAVFFTMLFLTGNTMMQSVRERIPEFAVLKTMGYSDRGVLSLVMAEGLILSLGSAGLGLFLSVMLFPLLARDGDRHFSLPLTVVATGAACAVVLAVVTGLLPALRVSRLKVVDALAGR